MDNTVLNIEQSPDVNDMVLFANVVEFGGFSAAARALNIPKSKVSRRIVRLETALGVRLLERTTRAIRVTEAGQLYLGHCKRIEEESRHALESIEQLMEVPRGVLRVSASITIGQYLLGPVLSDFIYEYPEVRLDMQLTNRRVDLVREGYDVVIRVGDLEDSSLISRRVGWSSARLYASPDYISKNSDPKRIDELEHHQVMVMSDSPRSEEWHLIGPDNREETVTVSPSVVVNDLTVVRQLAIDGVGIALLPRYLVGGLNKDLLIEVLPDFETAQFAIYALYPSHRGATPKVRAWIDFVISKLQI